MVPDHGLEEPGQDEHSEECLNLSRKRQMAFMGTKCDPTANHFVEAPERAPATLAWKESSLVFPLSEKNNEEEDSSSLSLSLRMVLRMQVAYWMQRWLRSLKSRSLLLP